MCPQHVGCKRDHGRIPQVPTNELLRAHKAARVGSVSGSINGGGGEVRVSVPQRHGSHAGSTTANSDKLHKLRVPGLSSLANQGLVASLDGGGIGTGVIPEEGELLSSEVCAGPVPVDETERLLALQMALKVRLYILCI